VRIHSLEHVPFEGLAQIQTWADQKKHTVTSTRLYRQDPLPPMDAFDRLIIMGGPMGANEDHRFSWMKGEKLFIEESIRREKPALGICLGAQLIASILGAKVYPNREKEIGWFPIELNPPGVRNTALNRLDQRSVVFHWHGDTFDIPSGAAHLARSRACENQAFAYAKDVIGLQFHLEVAPVHIEKMIANGAQDFEDTTFVMDPREIRDLSPRFNPPLNAMLYRFLDAWAKEETTISATPRV
jgi:GMP synthase-like glutamine amidotransferase